MCSIDDTAILEDLHNLNLKDAIQKVMNLLKELQMERLYDITFIPGRIYTR